MQHTRWLAGVVFLATLGAATNPMEKTLKLLDYMKETVIKDGEAEQKAYDEYFEWCDDEHFQIMSEIKIAKQHSKRCEADISRATSDLENAETKIEALVDQISQDEAKLNTAAKEQKIGRADFEISEKELVKAIDMLSRATEVLKQELTKGASFAQGTAASSNLQDVLFGLASVVDAASFAGDEDRRGLLALVDGVQESDEPGAPAAAAYTDHSGGILEAMGNLQDKAEDQLRKERQEESKSKHNFKMMEASLKAAISDNQQNLDEQKKDKAAAQDAKATSEGALEVTSKQLAAAIKTNEEVQHHCMQAAADHKATINGRKEELVTLQKVKKILEESVSFEQEPSSSFLQVALTSRTALKGYGTHFRLRVGSLSTSDSIAEASYQIVDVVKHVAKEHRSARLLQLAGKVATAMRYYSSTGRDPFKKIRGLIQDMIAKIESEASDEAEEKAFCDKELGESTDGRDQLSDKSDDLKATIDSTMASSAESKADVKELQKELAILYKSRAVAEHQRGDAKAVYTKASEDLKKALDGVQAALSVLRNYYGQAGASFLDEHLDGSFTQPKAPQKFQKSEGAGAGITGMLEVIEDDLSKELTNVENEEQDAQEAYDDESAGAKVDIARKEADAKLKTKNFKSLDLELAQHEGDLSDATDSLNAVNDYLAKLKERCVAKPETFEERTKKRNAEITGLRQALQILEDESAFVQVHR